MHTFFGLKKEMFGVDINGLPTVRESLFSGLRYERLGIVVTSPLGELGASLMIQLAITSYYDAPKTNRRGNPHFPEIYVFHLGGSYSEYSVLDGWPTEKQIFLPDSGSECLSSLNSHAITHLLLPESMSREEIHGFVEPNAAIDRLERCFLYSPSGLASNGDVSIRANDRIELSDVSNVIKLPGRLPVMVGEYPAPTDPDERHDNDEWVAMATQRLEDISRDDRTHARSVRAALETSAGVFETYREISSLEAVRRLGRIYTVSA